MKSTTRFVGNNSEGGAYALPTMPANTCNCYSGERLMTHERVLGCQGMLLRSLQADVNSLKSSIRVQTAEARRLGILLEDLEYRFGILGVTDNDIIASK